MSEDLAHQLYKLADDYDRLATDYVKVVRENKCYEAARVKLFAKIESKDKDIDDLATRIEGQAQTIIGKQAECENLKATIQVQIEEHGRLQALADQRHHIIDQITKQRWDLDSELKASKSTASADHDDLMDQLCRVQALADQRQRTINDITKQRDHVDSMLKASKVDHSNTMNGAQTAAMANVALTTERDTLLATNTELIKTNEDLLATNAAAILSIKSLEKERTGWSDRWAAMRDTLETDKKAWQARESELMDTIEAQKKGVKGMKKSFDEMAVKCATRLGDKDREICLYQERLEGQRKEYDRRHADLGAEWEKSEVEFRRRLKAKDEALRLQQRTMNGLKDQLDQTSFDLDVCIANEARAQALLAAETKKSERLEARLRMMGAVRKRQTKRSRDDDEPSPKRSRDDDEPGAGGGPANKTMV